MNANEARHAHFLQKLLLMIKDCLSDVCRCTTSLTFDLGRVVRSSLTVIWRHGDAFKIQTVQWTNYVTSAWIPSFVKRTARARYFLFNIYHDLLDTWRNATTSVPGTMVWSITIKYTLPYQITLQHLHHVDVRKQLPFLSMLEWNGKSIRQNPPHRPQCSCLTCHGGGSMIYMTHSRIQLLEILLRARSQVRVLGIGILFLNTS